MRFALDHAEYAPVHHLEGRGLQGDQEKQEPIFRCRQGTVLVDSKPARGPRLPIHAPCRHLGVERRLDGRDQLLKLVERQAREIQELHRAGLQLGKPYTSHGSCLLSLSRDIRGASYQKESGINSKEQDRAAYAERQRVVAVSAGTARRQFITRAHRPSRLVLRFYTVRPSMGLFPPSPRWSSSCSLSRQGAQPLLAAPLSPPV